MGREGALGPGKCRGWPLAQLGGRDPDASASSGGARPGVKALRDAAGAQAGPAAQRCKCNLCLVVASCVTDCDGDC